MGDNSDGAVRGVGLGGGGAGEMLCVGSDAVIMEGYETVLA